MKRALGVLALTAVALAAACGGAPAPASSGPSPALPPGRPVADSSVATLIPAGYGTLKQDDISIKLQAPGVLISVMPLDESVLRVLAPDSYRTLHAIVESRRPQITQRANLRGVRDPRIWLATFTGLEPDARFIPTDVTVTSGGREYRPFDVLPLTTGFGQQRLQPREVQRGLLLFEEGLDMSQPVTVTVGSERNTDWESILRTIDLERAAVRARAGGRP